MLTVNNLTVIRRDRTLIEKINLTLDKGKVYGLIGHNGSGKSTLIKVLSGEIKPSAGSVILQGDREDGLNNKGRLIHELAPKLLATQIAYLPQKLPDAAAFMVEELVMLGRYPWQKWLQKPSSEDKARVQEALTLTQTEQFIGQSVASLSGGERARVWLAMCIAQQTPCLLLDEPLAPLDMVYQVQVLKLIRQLAQEKNLAVVIIIHDINLAAQFCDEFIALRQGKLLHAGSVESMMRTEKLREIFDVDMHLLTLADTGRKVAVL